MYIKITTLFLAVIGGTLLPGCRKPQSVPTAVETILADDTIPSPVKQLVRAVADNDPERFAKLVSYPLARPYPLADIETEEEMKAYYPNLVDDSLRQSITHSGPSHWEKFGWRGWSLDDGRYVWVDDNVYAVNYVSGRERQMLDSLRNVEIASLPAGIRSGWQPVLCLRNPSDGTVYRIDARQHTGDGNEENTGAPSSDFHGDGHHYRLAVYPPHSDLRGMPGQLLDGTLEIEGSAATATYRFHAREGRDIELEPDSPDAGPTITGPGDTVATLTRAYWHNLVDMQGRH